MEVYKLPIEFAIIVFPFIAFILTIPFLIHQYRKYGAIPLLKSIVFYSLILYLITAYFMVILPLPTIETVKELKTSYLQLQPLNFINDIKLTTTIDFSNVSSILKFLNTSTVYTVVFNFLLTLPFGVYLRYFFNKKWYQSIIYSFLLSLFFELTQLSGLYFIYPRPYRLFDVDDLIINTLGGFFGFLITPLFMLFLPSQKELEQKSYEKGKKVSLMRRCLAFFIDILTITIISLVLKVFTYNFIVSKYSYHISICIYYLILPLIMKGETFGKMVVKIKIVHEDEKKLIKRYQILFRYIIFVFIIFFPSLWLNLLHDYNLIKLDTKYIMYIIEIIQFINILYYLVKLSSKKTIFLYEKITKTKNVSTIIVENGIEEQDVIAKEKSTNNKIKQKEKIIEQDKKK